MRAFLARHEKALLFLAVGAVWAFAYLAVNRWNAGRAAMPLVWDPVRSFPIVPVFVVPYLSAFPLAFFAAAGLRDREQYRRFALMIVAVMLFSAAVFVTLPLTILRPEPTGRDAMSLLLTWLYSVDRPVNMLPSMHVSISFLFAKAAALGWPGKRWLFLGWATLIAVSTLLIRQHYLADAVTGALLAQVAWALYPPVPRKRNA